MSDVELVFSNDLVRTRYWHALDDGRIQCDLCPRACRLHEGQRGLCFVRGRVNDQVMLATWGRSSGFCIDPVEKKPLNHFLPGTPVLSFGTAGCNLSCKFCQNWDISKSREMDALMDQAQPAAIAAAAREHGCSAVAFTYNDPVIFHEYAIDVARACHAEGLRNIAVTAGYVCAEPRAEFFAHMDAANVDLKAFSDDFYWKVTGARLQPVLDTLQYLYHDTDVWLELTTLLIPGLNDSDDEIRRMADWVVSALGVDVPMHFTAFHPDYRMTNVTATPLSTLLRARQIARDAGVQHVYIGNARDREASSTWCAHCHSLLIERDGYRLGQWHLDEHGHCRQCGTRLPGVFAGGPGNWGARRVPLAFC